MDIGPRAGTRSSSSGYERGLGWEAFWYREWESRFPVIHRKVDCIGVSEVELLVCEKRVKVDAVVADKIIESVDVEIGMDVIRQLGGVMIDKHGVSFGTPHSEGLVAINSLKGNTH
ncbi:hypothetical protein SK128_025758 [Halocaridina rubra]|uniref:Uncharacterized protein n=1 Tax=Halocaridina rubra TaxID=373956 RepID=A0AAN9A1F8_HALRR